MVELTRTGPRGFYWDPKRLPEASYDSNPLSPCAKEKLRTTVNMKEQHTAYKSKEFLALYERGSGIQGSTMGRHNPADRTRLLTDPRVQDLTTDVGFRRSLATNVVDLGPHVNTNILRFQRQQGFMTNFHKDAGPSYSPTACLGTWVEERHEPTYSSGFHARELGLDKRYQTEHSDRFRPTSEKYYDKLLTAEPLARFPDQPRKPSSKGLNESKGNHVYYSNKGFGEARGMDHTKDTSRGGYWVGTAPVKKHETISTTFNNNTPVEFQTRNANFDPKTKLLNGTQDLDMTNPRMAHTMKGLAESQRYATTWNTTYNSDFLDRSRRALTPEPAAIVTKLPARPNTTQ